MTSAEEALAAVLSAARPLDAEPVPPGEALDRVLAADLAAAADLPPFDNSAMDGYAVRSADVGAAGPANPVRLRVLARVTAGMASPEPVAEGTAVPVMTGAPLPAGADAVVMKECARRVNGTVEVLVAARPGEHVRRAGEDVRAGAALLRAGTRLRAYEVALLCAQRVASVPVRRRPTALVVPTGDELAGAGRAVIGDSNGPALAALFSRWGALACRAAPVKDDAAALRAAFSTAAGVDVLVVTGGVSEGDLDLTLPVLMGLGLRLVFHKVAVKPGKPLLFGTLGRTLVFGLPGNPVAALVCAEEFVRPALEALRGLRPGHPSFHMSGVLDAAYPAPRERRLYLFCVARPQGAGFVLSPLRPQGAAMLAMASRANALAVVEPGRGRLEAGDCVPFRWLK